METKSLSENLGSSFCENWTNLLATFEKWIWPFGHFFGHLTTFWREFLEEGECWVRKFVKNWPFSGHLATFCPLLKTKNGQQRWRKNLAKWVKKG